MNTLKMDKLHFLVNWGQDKEKAWSGTNYSLFQSLSKHYNVNDIQVKTPGKINKVVTKYLLKDNRLGINDININRDIADNLEGKVFQFTEFVSDTPKRKTFIYQDLCVNYLEELSISNRKILDYSGFSIFSDRAIKKRNKSQIEYYYSCSGVFLMGKWITEYLKKQFPEIAYKFHHVGGGINLDRTKINSIQNKTNNKILFIGRDYKRKGGAEVIKAFQLLKSRYPNLELHFAGPKENPVPECIEGYFFYGDANRNTLQHLMNTCDIFCMPSHFEAYGLVFIEALSFGLPCIGRDAYEMPYFIEEGVTGELIKTESIQELVDKIEVVLNTPSYKDNVMAKREFYLQEYSWDTVAQRISTIIDSI